MLKSNALRAAVVAVTMAMGQAYAATPSVDVPAGDLISALETFAAQAGVELVFNPAQLKGMKTNGARGALSSEEAVRKLIEGTPLILRADPSGVLLIALPEPASSHDAAPVAPEREYSRGVPEILVEGARTLNMDIERTKDDPQPYVIFDRKRIESSGASNVQSFLKNHLPMNTTLGSPNQTISGFFGNSSSVNLRGLGTNQTLILVDGRRAANINNGGTPLQADLNGIPLSAIERIEVLPSTASGIYGGGATGGVINIILRRDYQGAEVKVTYDNSFDTDSASRQFDFSSGFFLEQGRTNVMLSGTYSEANSLRVKDRDFVQRAYAHVMANSPSFINSNSLMPKGYTTNIRSANGSNLVLDDGTPLNSSYTYIPVGYAGVATDGGAALVQNAGQYNPLLASTPQIGFLLQGGEQALYHPPTLKSVSGTVRREFSSHVSAFVEAYASDNDSRTFSNVSLQAPVTIAANAPNNPFTTPIQVSVADGSASSMSSTKIESRRVGGGVIVKLPADWLAEADYTLSWGSMYFSSPTNLPAALTAQIASGAVDVMRDTNLYPLGFSPSQWQAHGQETSPPFRSRTVNPTLRFAGPVASLPGGEVRISTALEYRKDELDAAAVRAAASNGVTYNINAISERSQAVTSGYVEALIPLIGAGNAMPGAQNLDLQLAVRYDDYATRTAGNPTATTTPAPIEESVSSTNPTIALRYQIVDDVAVRTSYGTGFLPARVDQLLPSEPPFASSTPIADPRRGGSAPAGPYQQITGGNPNLRPEDSESWSAGLIFTPRFVEGLRLSVDYSRFEKTNNITALTVQQVVDNEALLPGRVVRGPNLPGDPAGWAGPILQIDTSFANISKAKIEAYDAQLDYEFHHDRFGSFALFAVGTWQESYQTQVAPSTAMVENVGFRNRPLRFKADAGITWQLRQWSAGWSTHYFDSYLVYGPTDAPAVVARLTAAQGNGGRVKDQIYHDIFASYRFEGTGTGRIDGLLDGTQLRFGINNVFNAIPPVDVQANLANAAYSLYGDPRLRTYQISLTKSFGR